MKNELILFGIILIGSIGYWIASGASRADYKAFHVVIGVSLFCVLWLGIYWVAEQCLDNLIIKILISSLVVGLVACFWRKYFADWVFQCLRRLKITTTGFGPSRAWDALESAPDGREFHYVRVHLTNGEKLGSDQSSLARKWKEKRIDFPPDIITDEQGNIVLVVTEIWDKDADEPEKHNPVDEHGRTEFTYIPASNIVRIQTYIKHE